MSEARSNAVKGLKKKKVIHAADRVGLLEGEWSIVVDQPDTYISRITLNNPDWENRMNNRMRAQLYEQLQLNDQNPDVRVTIIRGAGKSFCAGYEQALSSKDSLALPMFTDNSDGEFQRNTLAGWFMIMDLSKPVIAQVHGACLSAGSELASACDLVYVTPSASIGYPEVRNYGLPDMQMYPWLTGMRNALAIMLLAETMDGTTAVQRGWATAVYPEEELEAKVLERARRVAKIPSDLLAYNKRSVHRAFEAQGMRTNLRHGTDLEALMWHSNSAQILRRAETLYLRNSPSNKRGASPPQRARSPAAKTTPRPSLATRTVTSPPRQRTPPPSPPRQEEKTSAPPRVAPQRKMESVAQREPRTSVPPPVKPKPEKLESPPSLPRVARPVQRDNSGNKEKRKVESTLAPTPPVTNFMNPAVVAKAGSIAPTPASNATSASDNGEGIFIHINKPIAIHIHSSEDPRSKL